MAASLLRNQSSVNYRKIQQHVCRTSQICILTNILKRCMSSQEGVRVRFGPSPTGYLHIGGLRTALYNCLFARANKGKFILRIEDTDRSRLVPGALEHLQDTLNWAGLTPDEGPNNEGEYGPYIQSERLHMYQSHIKTLLHNGTAYPCFCTTRRLELMKREASRKGEQSRYDNRCASLSEEEVEENMQQGKPYVVRLKLEPTLDPWQDSIRGPIVWDVMQSEGDPVLMKTDGFPTYHFANVVDDHLMKISHVLRGEEWVNSTPKHLLIYKAFGWQPPVFAHLPLLINSDGSKLSKRQGDIHIDHYRLSGYFPKALVNFMTIAGGGFDTKELFHKSNNLMTVEELGQKFDISKVRPKSNQLDPNWLSVANRLQIEDMVASSPLELVHQLRELVVTTHGDKIKPGPVRDQILSDDYIKMVIDWSLTDLRISTLKELVAPDYAYLWVAPTFETFQKIKMIGLAVEALTKVIPFLETHQDFSMDGLKQGLQTFVKENKFSNKAFLVFRLSLTGIKQGAPVAEMMSTIGKERTILRLQNTIKELNSL